MNHESLPGITPEKSNSGEESACATVAFVAETQFGADRDAVWLTVISKPSVPRFRDDSQPAGRYGGVTESKFSIYGYPLSPPAFRGGGGACGGAWSGAVGVTTSASSWTKRNTPERSGKRRRVRKPEIKADERCLTFQAIISIYCVSNTTRDHGPVTNSSCR